MDTSAFYALLDFDDPNHEDADHWFRNHDREPGNTLVTHNYVVIESAALVQSRLGKEAARSLLEKLAPKSAIFFVDQTVHALASAAFLAGGTRTSLVDRTSFEVMRKLGLSTAFAFDVDFSREGFETVP